MKEGVPMLIPRYYFSNEYTELYDYFLSQPHRKRTFHRGEYLWKPGELIHKVYYIISGISVTYAEHEEGRRKILFFHTTGSVFPGFLPEKVLWLSRLSWLQVYTRTKKFHNWYYLPGC